MSPTESAESSESSVSTLTRRDFVQAGLAVAALGSVARLAAASDIQSVYKRAFPIDTLSMCAPKDDPSAAIAAGISAIVMDIMLYPRDFANATEVMKAWTAEFARPGTRYMKVERAEDIAAAKKAGKMGIILTCQDASILGVPCYSVNDTNIKNLESFHAAGMRVLQITHNDRNGLGDSYQEKTNTGLSLLGEAVVTNMNRLRMLVDLSHCGDRTTLEAVALSTRPCAITHAACRALYDTGRAKNDNIIKAVTEKGGYFGVFNMSMWLTGDDKASIDHVLNHIDHAVKLAGLDHVGFGSDGGLTPDENQDLAQLLAGMQAYVKRTQGRPGSEHMPKHVVVAELNSVHRMERLAIGLNKRGYSDDAVEKIIGGNFKRIFGEVCG